MDGNKDEALKCLQIAKDSIQSGDRTRALKFITKARRLDPSLQADDLLSNLNSSKPENDNPNKPNNETPFDPLSNGPRRRIPTGSSSSAVYTQEQVAMVREIKKKKDYYEILGVEKNCSGDEIRKAYRKLSLKVHPDKNNAPGAEEAFKIVSKAFQCLSDEESRKKYDVVGTEEVVYARRGGGNGNGNGMRGFNGFFDGDVDADEIFRNFFFGGMNPATTANFNGFSFGPGVRVRTGGGGGGADQGNNWVRTGGGGGGADQGNNWVRTCIQLLPVILIILVNFLPSSEPMYSLSRQYSYNHRFTTQKGVNFFVKSASFDREYPPNSQERVEIERQVEVDYRSVLTHNCRQEYQQFQWGYRRETPNCDALKRFDAVAQ